MRILAALSLKGGVGKTTTVLGLASAATTHGLSVLVVDLDPQCNATTALDPPDSTASIADVFTDPRKRVLDEAIVASAWPGKLDVLVGSEDIEQHNRPNPNDRQLLRLARAVRSLPELGRRYDLVLIDCPPSLGQLTRSGLLAAQRALLVTEPTMFAVAGVRRAYEAVVSEQKNNASLGVAGVLVNRVRSRTAEHRFRLAELREIFGDLVLATTLPDRAALQQAQGSCKPIHGGSSEGAKIAAAHFDELLAQLSDR